MHFVAWRLQYLMFTNTIAGVLVSMPTGPALVSTPSIPQPPQPKSNIQQGKSKY